MASECGRCGAKLDIQRSRRPALYCSSACRQAAYRARQPKIPAEMRGRDRWVSWKPVTRGDKVTKMPVQLNGRPASSTDPKTWVPYAKVAGEQRKGFVLGEGIGCIDLDHCLIDGVLTPAAERFLASLPDTYIEISPSGDGLHVFGLIPEGRGRRQVIDGLFIETYSIGRYMTVTGNVFRGSTSKLADLSALI